LNLARLIFAPSFDTNQLAVKWFSRAPIACQSTGQYHPKPIPFMVQRQSGFDDQHAAMGMVADAVGGVAEQAAP
jgi:hypothetical protein